MFIKIRILNGFKKHIINGVKKQKVKSKRLVIGPLYKSYMLL